MKQQITISLLTAIFMMTLINNFSYSQVLPGKTQKCIVSLTYDDGLDIDLDNVVPVLDSLGLKGTFYVPVNSSSLDKRMEEWKEIAGKGHELGNHTSFHPCNGKSKKRDWVSPDYDMDIYTMNRMVDEIKLANVLLKAIDGKNTRTFAYTCGDQEIAGENIWDKIKDEFIAARGVNGEMPKLDEIKLNNIGSYMIADKSGQEMIDMVKMAMKNNSLIVFLFHGVGGGHNINVSMEAHSKLLHFLKENEKEIWVAPFIEVAEYAKSNQVK
jgi:peptidoglycan/xylan/chitin deacetylase (PgdA/CDA1 family)